MRMLRESLGKVVMIALLASLILGVGLISGGSTIVRIHDVSAKFLTDVNGTLFFVGYDDVHGRELWRSDGTEAGTFMVKDIIPESRSSDPAILTDVNGTLFFTTSGGLWKSDGTEVGTVLVKSDLGPSKLTNVNGTLFFTAFDDVHGRELWKSDGTEAGTVLVKNIRPGPFSSNIVELTNMNGTLFFIGNDFDGPRLWKSDGTEAGTIQVHPRFGFRELTPVDGTLFFRDRSPPGRSVGTLWKSDGTEEGTVNLGVAVLGLTSVNGVLFFISSYGVGTGVELWKSDGTEAGTFMVKDIFPGGSSSGPGLLTNVNGVLFFIANDGVHGRELWKSDGTEAGTVLVRDIEPGSDFIVYGGMTAVNDNLFFTMRIGVLGTGLWKSDGTQAGTFMIEGLDQGTRGAEVWELTDVSGTLFFKTVDPVVGLGLYKVASGTVEPTPTPTNQPISGDTDGDGCTDEQELGPNETLGGRRDPNNFWDFFDPNRDRSVGLLDFLAVLRHFGTVGDPSAFDLNEPEPPAGEYWVLADRGGQMPNGDPWDELPANGSIGLSDFLSVLRQFGHTCA